MRKPLHAIYTVTRTLAVAAALILATSRIYAADSDGEAGGPGSLRVEADEYELDSKTGWAEGRGNVRISYQGMVVESQKVRINVQTKDMEASGGIYFYQLEEPGVETPDKSFFWRGEEIKGNLDKREFTAGRSGGKLDEWFAVAGTGQFKESGDAVFTNVHVSTCEHILEERAHYRIEAKEVVYRQSDGQFIAKHAVYKVGNVPILYLPVVAWDTDNQGGNVKYRIGYSDNWGAFVTVAKGWKMHPGAETEFKIDAMSKRGVGIGNTSRWSDDNGFTELHLYGVADTDPPEDDNGMNRRFDTDDVRYRGKVFHYAEPGEKLRLRINVDVLSDIDMLEEWYKREFKDYQQPTSYGDLRYDGDYFSVSLGAKFRVNDFYTVSEKLPELRLDVHRQPVVDSPFYYQSETTIAYLRMNWRDFGQDYFWPAAPIDLTANYQNENMYESSRIDTVQMLYLPIKAGNVLQVIPRGGVRLTYYGTTSERKVTDDELKQMFSLDDPNLTIPVNNTSYYDDDGGDAVRFAGEAGVEVTSKIVGTWQDARNDFWGIDGFRHIVEPYANYTYVSKPTESREELLYFDEVDRLREENFIRFGAAQRFQTRREKAGVRQVYTLARVDTYADIHLDSSDGRETEGDFVTKFRADPMEELAFWGTILADMHVPEVRWLEVGTRFGNPDRATMSIAYVLRDEYRRPPITTFGSTITDYAGEDITSGNISDVSAAVLTLEGRLDDRTTASALFLYDFEETELANHIYTINRDLHCWTGSVFFGEDYGDLIVGFALRLNAFPDIAIEADIY